MNERQNVSEWEEQSLDFMFLMCEQKWIASNVNVTVVHKNKRASPAEAVTTVASSSISHTRIQTFFFSAYNNQTPKESNQKTDLLYYTNTSIKKKRKRKTNIYTHYVKIQRIQKKKKTTKPTRKKFITKFSNMTDLAVDLGTLPDDVREKLAELDLELSEGNCTRFNR